MFLDPLPLNALRAVSLRDLKPGSLVTLSPDIFAIVCCWRQRAGQKERARFALNGADAFRITTNDAYSMPVLFLGHPSGDELAPSVVLRIAITGPILHNQDRGELQEGTLALSSSGPLVAVREPNGTKALISLATGLEPDPFPDARQLPWLRSWRLHARFAGSDEDFLTVAQQ